MEKVKTFYSKRAYSSLNFKSYFPKKRRDPKRKLKRKRREEKRRKSLL
jgi:hypothetical protein